MLWQHFGLGNASIIDSIIVFFTTGTVKVMTNVPVNQSITIADLNCLTGISNNEIPSKYELKQNYPNPFNPATMIEYSLMKSGVVRLTVYDMAGKLIST